MLRVLPMITEDIHSMDVLVKGVSPTSVENSESWHPLDVATMLASPEHSTVTLDGEHFIVTPEKVRAQQCSYTALEAKPASKLLPKF